MGLRSLPAPGFLLGPVVEPQGLECHLPLKVRLVAEEELVILGDVDPGHGDIELRTAPLAATAETSRAEVAAVS